jgi:hypothetical protein
MFLDKCELFGIGESTIEPDTNYSGTIGCQMAMVDGFANDMKMFEAMLISDAKLEEMAIKESAEEEITSLEEASFKGFIERVKAMWDRIKTKVIGVIHTFVAKLSAWMGKNGKAYYDKYAEEIEDKDFSGLKVRYSAPTGLSGMKVKVDGAGIIATLRNQVNKAEPLEKEELSKLFLKASIQGVNVTDDTLKEFKTSFHKLCFAEENKEYQVSEPKKMLEFIATEDVIKKMQEMEKEQRTALSSFDKDIKKFEDEYKRKAKIDPTATADEYNHAPRQGETGYTRSQASTLIGNMTKGLSALQPAINKALAAVMTEYKFGVAQSRRVMSAMVLYSPKKKEVKESFMQDEDVLNFMQEAVEAEVYSDLEAF